MVDATPVEPFCYGNADLFVIEKPVCSRCAFLHACCAWVEGPSFADGTPRKEFVEALVRSNISRYRALEVIEFVYGVTHDAARKQFDRWRKKLGYPQ